MFKRIVKPVLGCMAAGLGVAAWGSWEHHHPKLVVRELPILPPGSASLQILHISDLHLTLRQKYLVDFTAALAALEPDLVVSTGDNFSSTDALPAVVAAYRPLFEFPGVFVFGSNDYFSGRLKNPARYLFADSHTAPLVRERDLPFQDLARVFTAAGWADLNNAATTLALTPRGTFFEAPLQGPCRVEVSFLGVDDPHLDLDSMPEPDFGWGQAQLRIGVAHAPYRRVLDDFAVRGADLVFAGHTHGGQWCVPGYGALVTNCDLPTDLVSGMFTWPGGDKSGFSAGSTVVNISRGLGASRFTPLRFACRPEAVLIRLVVRAQADATTVDPNSQRRFLLYYG